MTNNIESLINAAMIEYHTIRFTAPARDYDNLHPFHRLTFAFARLANAELTAALAPSTTSTPSNFDRYYFSDSTYDEITNPLSFTADAESLFAILYECAPDEYPTLASIIADDIDYMLDIDDRTFANLTELIDLIETTLAN